ncbi:putative retrotransposon gag domain, aspartic peptidase domain protein [Tanacetum coccineum]
MGSDFAKLREDFKSALNILGGNMSREIHDLRGMLMGETTRMRGEVEEEWRSLRRELEDLRADIALCKRFMASGGGLTSNITPKVEVPKPSPFMGKREARAVDDLLWEMEQYMKGVNIVDDAAKIKTATRYLKDTAALWWRRRYRDIGRGTCTINTWADFVQNLKKQFYSENDNHKAKSRLRKLKYSRMMLEHVKEFTTLTELERRGVQDLAKTIAHAEALIDLGEWRSCKPINKDSGDVQYGGEKQVKDQDDGTQRPPRKEKTSYKSIKCFVCDGPHKARDCPKKLSFHAMMAETEEGSCEEEDAHMGSMRVLNAINARKESPTVGAKNNVRVESPKIEAKSNKSKRAPKVETKGNPRTKSKAEATGLRFEAKRLGLETMKDNGWIKAVNGDAKAISVVAQGVKTKIEIWEGELDLLVVPMDDYKLVPGMEFFDKRHKEWSQDNVRNVARERLQGVEAKYERYIKRQDLREFYEICKKVLEAIGRCWKPWKVLEARRNPRCFHSWKVVEYGLTFEL